MIKEFTIIMVLMTVTEMVCAFYVQKVSDNKAIAASIYCAINTILAKYIIIETVQSNYLILACGIGAFLGTYIVIKYFPSK